MLHGSRPSRRRPRNAATSLLAIAGLALPLFGALGARSESPAADPAPSPAAEASSDAATRAPIERLYETLLEVMQQAEELGFDGRYAKLEPVVNETYDMEFMASRVVGRQYQRLAPEEQALWLKTFGQLTISTYADRFDGFDGERLEIGAVEESAGDTRIVRTVLHPSDDEPVQLDYRMRNTAAGWRIVDVYLSGTVSELALRRSDYSGVLRSDGFEAL
ncbi:MAG: ABC transporter substrate-binding protein, partial [Myxococcales bacterium]|nr:ABC transporter substrate-binding protein [Myxococcales bacterium]